jgi:alkaline phosphatase
MKLSLRSGKTFFVSVLFSILILSASCATNSSVSTSSAQNNIKYVFYFIGDGMGPVQVHATEAYKAAMEEGYKENAIGMKKMENLTFSNFPAFGMVTTYCANRFITDSAAAGTALACGEKTLADTVSVGTDRKKRFTTIAEQAKSKEMKVGIVTSVGIDHATPAVFYAHEANRNSYYNIGVQLANSNFDYFAGASLHQPNPPRRTAGRRGSQADANAADANAADVNAPAAKNTYEVAKDNGFKIATSREELGQCKPGERVIAYNKAEESRNELYPAIDKHDDCVSLAEFTAKGIELLDNENGFFMMVEGGQIDEACHNNDAVTAIYEALAFEKAIDEAMNFYRQHQNETLIVVTSDHETGGMSLGYSSKEYSTSFEILKNQKMSQGRFTDTVLSKYRSSQWSGIEDNVPNNLKADINDVFGIAYNSLNAYEKNLLEDAYDKYMSGVKRVRVTINEFPEQDKLLYSDKNPVSVTLTHILGNKAGIGWTTFAHTGIPVEVHAIGTGCEIFNGFYDNTDVPKKMAKIMDLELKN